MKRSLFLILALLLAATFISCGGSADPTTEPGGVASSEPTTAGFDIDRFFNQITANPPLGVVYVTTSNADESDPNPPDTTRELKRAAGPIVLNEITYTLRGAAARPPFKAGSSATPSISAHSLTVVNPAE